MAVTTRELVGTSKVFKTVPLYFTVVDAGLQAVFAKEADGSAKRDANGKPIMTDKRQLYRWYSEPVVVLRVNPAGAGRENGTPYGSIVVKSLAAFDDPKDRGVRITIGESAMGLVYEDYCETAVGELPLLAEGDTVILGGTFTPKEEQMERAAQRGVQARDTYWLSNVWPQ